jgi:uroporphyrinogen-III synthase
LRPVYLISKTPYEGVIHIPILTISFLNPTIDFTQYEGIILTSKQALIALENYTFTWENLHCICVSDSTAEAAQHAGAMHIEVGNGYGKSIPDVLHSKKRQGKWLYIRPKVIASEWLERAREQGIVVDEVVVYETICNKDANAFSISDDALLVFTSPSSIECFCASYSILPSHSIVAIGKTTQSAFKNAKEVFVSPKASVASAVQLAQEIAKNSSPF